MAHPQFADGGEGLQIWRVDVNILNKQLWTADKGWSSISGLDVELTTPHHKRVICYKIFLSASDLE
jgi:hypothetical protein